MPRSGVVSASLLSVLLITALAACGGKTQDAMPSVTAASSSPTTVVGSDWSAPTDVVAAADAAGLSLDSEEHLDVHYHSHLDVVVDGEAVTVPANLGIDVATERLAHLHTHDATGILHVEAPADDVYTLGQVLTLWGLGFDAKGCLNGVCPTGDAEWAVVVDGAPLPNGPAAAADLPLESLQQISLVYGDAAQRAAAPASFDWAALNYDA